MAGLQLDKLKKSNLVDDYKILSIITTITTTESIETLTIKKKRVNIQATMKTDYPIPIQTPSMTQKKRRKDLISSIANSIVRRGVEGIGGIMTLKRKVKEAKRSSSIIVKMKIYSTIQKKEVKTNLTFTVKAILQRKSTIQRTKSQTIDNLGIETEERSINRDLGVVKVSPRLILKETESSRSIFTCMETNHIGIDKINRQLRMNSYYIKGNYYSNSS